MGLSIYVSGSKRFVYWKDVFSGIGWVLYFCRMFSVKLGGICILVVRLQWNWVGFVFWLYAFSGIGWDLYFGSTSSVKLGGMCILVVCLQWN